MGRCRPLGTVSFQLVNDISNVQYCSEMRHNHAQLNMNLSGAAY